MVGRNWKAVFCVRNQEVLIERKALDFSSAFRYNLVRSSSEAISDLPSVNSYYEIASFTLGGGMLFLFVVMVVYVRQCREDYKQQS